MVFRNAFTRTQAKVEGGCVKVFEFALPVCKSHLQTCFIHFLPCLSFEESFEAMFQPWRTDLYAVRLPVNHLRKEILHPAVGLEQLRIHGMVICRDERCRF